MFEASAIHRKATAARLLFREDAGGEEASAVLIREAAEGRAEAASRSGTPAPGK